MKDLPEIRHVDESLISVDKSLAQGFEERPYEETKGSDPQERERKLSAEMFVNPAELLKDPDEAKNPFNVNDPSRAEGGNHIVYTVRGVIEGAEFECKRRYKEFHLMRTALANRWPGVYIPGVPPKKAMGNLEEAFLQERRHFLDKFIKQIGRYGFL